MQTFNQRMQVIHKARAKQRRRAQMLAALPEYALAFGLWIFAFGLLGITAAKAFGYI